LVFALSQGIPVMALSWSHKYLELLKEFELENFVIERNELNTKRIIDLLDQLWVDKKAWSKVITSALPAVLQRVDGVFDKVASTIKCRIA